MTWLLHALGLAFCVGQYLLLHYIYGIDNNTALTDCIVSFLTFFTTAWGVIQSIKVYPTRVGLILYSIFIAAFFAVVTVYFSNIIIHWWVDKDPNYLTFLSHSLPARYIIAWLLFSWFATYASLSKIVSGQEKKFKQQVDSATLLKEAELFKLRQQLQPHFLYNSLNSISALTIIEPAKAQEMIGQLSDFLRNSVKREGKEQINIQDELEYLRNYLAIESIRFGDRLKVIFHNGATADAILPPFLLQPIIENAIKFGLYGNTGAVTITVDITLHNGILSFIITNPVDGDSVPPTGTGFGLTGIQRRLYLLYARADLLETIKDENTFTTILKIPQEHV
jgi:two-component system LytT family sensor kinase